MTRRRGRPMTRAERTERALAQRADDLTAETRTAWAMADAVVMLHGVDSVEARKAVDAAWVVQDARDEAAKEHWRHLNA
jgi:hypothetical protein